MLKISSPIAPVAAAAVVLVTAIGVSTPVGGAYASDCIGAPKAASPHGQHWYYRIERSTGRKCWYLHAFLLRPHRAAKPSEAHLAAAESTIAAPAPAPPPPSANAPNPAGRPNSAVHPPQVKILTVRTVQFANPPTVQAAQQSIQHQTVAPSVLPASGNENRKALNTAKSTAAVEPTTDGADPLEPNRASSPPDADHTMKPKALATIGPTQVFFLLVLGIGLATFVIGVVIKIAGGQRALPILEDPDSAWRRYCLGHQRPDPEASNALASRARTRLSAARSKIPASTLAGLSVPGLKELEPALRALGEARQHEVA